MARIRMMNKLHPAARRLSFLLLLAMPLLLTGCIKEAYEGGADGDDTGYRSVNVQMSVGARAGEGPEEVDGIGARETDIESLRVYAFSGGEQVGYFHAPSIAANTKEYKFNIKIRQRGNIDQQTVRLYLIANEAGAQYKDNFAWSDQLTEGELDGIKFTYLNSGKYLPATLKTDVVVDFVAGTMSQTEFELPHPVGKLSVQFRKAEGMTDVLTVTRITVGNLLDYNYLMDNGKLDLPLLSGTNSTTSNLLPSLNGNQELVIRDNPTENEGYTDANISYYPFENKNGKDTSADPMGWWKTPFTSAEGPGATITIAYSLGTNQRTSTIYMPPIERNSWHDFRVTVKPNAVIEIAYSVAQWDKVNIEQELEHPHTITSPAKRGDYTGHTYWTASTADDEEAGWAGAFGMNFQMPTPKDKTCTVSLSDATNFEYRILHVDAESGEKTPIVSTDPESSPKIPGDDKTYLIEVRPRNNIGDNGLEAGATTHLFVSIDEYDWYDEDSRLMINPDYKADATPGSYWPGGIQYITITQVAAPTTGGGDESE